MTHIHLYDRGVSLLFLLVLSDQSPSNTKQCYLVCTFYLTRIFLVLVRGLCVVHELFTDNCLMCFPSDKIHGGLHPYPTLLPLSIRTPILFFKHSFQDSRIIFIYKPPVVPTPINPSFTEYLLCRSFFNFSTRSEPVQNLCPLPN